MFNFAENVKFLRRFFEPAISNKITTTKLLSESTFNAIWFDLIPLISLPYLNQLINISDYQKVINLCLVIGLIYIIIWTLHYFIRKWDIQAKYVYFDYLNKKYRKKILLKDNLEMEKVGTGYVQSVVQSGFESWVTAVWEMIYQFPRIFSGILSGVYITYKMGNIYLFLFLILSTVSIVAFYYFKKIKFIYDTKVNDIENKISNNSVRMIMSREEVLFAEKQNAEVNLISSLYKDQKKEDTKAASFDFLADLAISSMAVSLPFIGIVLIVSLQNDLVNPTLLLAFIYFSSRFSFSLWQIVWGIKIFIEKYAKIKKFWDFIDNVPELYGYDQGKTFNHTGGEIELKNINFSYEK